MAKMKKPERLAEEPLDKLKLALKEKDKKISELLAALEKAEVAKQIIVQTNTLLDQELYKSTIVRKVGEISTYVSDYDKTIKRLMALLSQIVDYDAGILLLSRGTNNILSIYINHPTGKGFLDDFKKKAIEAFNTKTKNSLDMGKFTEEKIIYSEAAAAKGAEKRLQEALDEKVNSFCALALHVGEEIFGLIAVSARRTEAFTKGEMDSFDIITDQATIIIDDAARYKALRKSEEEFRLTFENAKDAIFWAVPATGLVINCNKAAEELLEKGREEIIGRSQTAVHPPQKMEYYTRMFKRHVEQKGSFDEEAEVITKSGKIIPVNITASITLIGDKPIIQGLFRDITERKRAEEALQTAYTKLKDTQAQLIQSAKLSTIGQLGAGVAHELNNPIGGILGYAQFILQKLSRPDFADKDFKTCKQYVEYIEKESVRCRAIVANLLSFSRKPIGGPEPVDVKQAIENTLLIVKHQLKVNNIKLTADYEPDLPPISGYISQLQQVFTNIIVNAQHAMPDGGELDISTKVRVMEGKKYIVTKIKDTGCGIAKEDIEKIFEAFFTTKQDWKSVGIGLSITYRIVKEHKGTITVDSEVGKGTTFTITLPAA